MAAMTAAATAPSTNGASTSTVAMSGLAGPVGQHGAGGEHRAAEVGQHDHAGALVDARDRVGDAAVAGAELALVGAAGHRDRQPRAADLQQQLAKSTRQGVAVRDQYDAHGFRGSNGGPGLAGRIGYRHESRW